MNDIIAITPITFNWGFVVIPAFIACIGLVIRFVASSADNEYAYGTLLVLYRVVFYAGIAGMVLGPLAGSSMTIPDEIVTNQTQALQDQLGYKNVTVTYKRDSNAIEFHQNKFSFIGTNQQGQPVIGVLAEIENNHYAVVPISQH